MLTLISFIVVLSFLVFVHELGHYLAARIVGVHVLEFSIGFPPKIASKIIGRTKYMISWLPFGGYVRLKGQDIEEEDPHDPENYAAKSVFQRFFILIAGPFMNLLVAVIFMILIFLIGYKLPAFMLYSPVLDGVKTESVAEKAGLQKGDLILEVNGQEVATWRETQQRIKKSQSDQVVLTLQRGEQTLQKQINLALIDKGQGIGWNIRVEPVVGQVVKDSPAWLAGIRENDTILTIDDQIIASWSYISPIIRKSEGKELKVTLLRGSQVLHLYLVPRLNKELGYWTIGINSATITVSDNFSDAVVLGTVRTWSMAKYTLSFLWQMITGKVGSDSVGGPIMIAQMVGEATRDGASELIYLVGFISLQLGLFNLLPIPALDGGHIFFLVIEKLKGGTLSKNFRMNIQKIGFSLLMFLILYISFQDGLRLFQ